MLFCHIIATTVLFFGYEYVVLVQKSLQILLIILLIVHAIISFINIIFFNEGDILFRYIKINFKTFLQRVTGILLLVSLIIFHMGAYGFIMSGASLSIQDKLFICISEVFFYLIVLLHVYLSFSNSLVTLGFIRSKRSQKNINIFVGIICIFMFAISSFPAVLFVANWSIF